MITQASQRVLNNQQRGLCLHWWLHALQGQLSSNQPTWLSSNLNGFSYPCSSSTTLSWPMPPFWPHCMATIVLESFNSLHNLVPLVKLQ